MRVWELMEPGNEATVCSPNHKLVDGMSVEHKYIVNMVLYM